MKFQHKNLSITAVLFLLIALSSCSKKSYPTQTKSIFPLAVGNTRTYEESYYYNNIWDSLRSKRNVYRVITKDTLLAEDQLAYIVEETTGNNTRRYMWYEKEEQLIEANFNYEELQVLITNNLKKGLTWDMWPSVDRTPENDEKSVVEEYTSYPFLNKNFHAFRFQSGIKDLLQNQKTGHLADQLYAPAIGMIEETYYANFYGPTRTYRVLTDYYIN